MQYEADPEAIESSVRKLRVLGQSLDENIVLQNPILGVPLTPTIDRPELKLYDAQTRMLDQQNSLIHSRLLPKTSLFVQGGV